MRRFVSNLATFAFSAVLCNQGWGQIRAAQDPEHAQGTTRGIYNFAGYCASCHDSHKDNAPDRNALTKYTAEEVLASMALGPMAPYAKGLTDGEMRTLAVYVAGRPLGSAPAGEASAMKNQCTGKPSTALLKGPTWNGWGIDASNSRFQPTPGLTADQVPQLKLKWAFGFPNGNSAYSQPAVTGGRVFVGADTGYVYSLDAASGCVRWSYKAKAGVRTSIAIGPGKGSANFLAYFGDLKGNVYAINAGTGAEVWIQRADTHPIARITGSPKLEGGRLYVPVASLEESSGGNPKYPCCTFRGSVVAYDAMSGKVIWKTYAIPEEPKPIKKTSLGTQVWGPAGAGIWTAPAIDTKRHALYVAIGNSYTEPAVSESDGVMALDLNTGKRLWMRQLMANDASVSDCRGSDTNPKSETCPEHGGPDSDVDTAPILRTLPDGRGLVIVGQKNGDAWALDPDKEGAIVWRRMVGRGPEAGGGGMIWGFAADDKMAYFPVTGRAARAGELGPIGLSAVNLATGEVGWRADPPVASAAPPVVIPGVIFSASTAGLMYAYSTQDGRMLWQFDTAKEFSTVNGVPAKGGNMNSLGPVVSGGMLFVPSGYSDLGGGVRGNVLLAFGIDGSK
jgi:polyvinyl alcohol dehydrogenase (cytochrome)